MANKKDDTKKSEVTNFEEEFKVETGNMFEIGDDVQGTKLGQFAPPIQTAQGYDFPKGFLSKVESKEIEIKSGDSKGEKRKVLDFTFTDTAEIDKAKVRFIHTEWELEEVTTDDGKKKFEGAKARIKHIHDTVNPNSSVILGQGATSFGNWFEIIANQFNEGANGKPVFFNKPLFIFVCYQKSKDITQFPLFPNFIEIANKPKPVTITIDTRYNRITPKKASSSLPGMDSPSDFPMGGDEFPA
jgi:hypothetical protein